MPCSITTRRLRLSHPGQLRARLRRATTQNAGSHAIRRRRPEITRFKGLGEISPNEFKQFIGKEMRLSQVEYAPKVDSQQILSFYMGKNTPERKDYIMENLVVTVEE